MCNAALSAESLKPSKLKRHLEKNHPNYVIKDLEFFRRYKAGLKRQKLDFTGNFQQENAAATQASYEVALQIAKQKKPHTVGESLVKPCLLKAVKLVLGESSEAKMRQISLSNDTIQRRISDMSEDVKEQVINEMKTSPLFSLQVDETTDVASCAQLLVFVRYIHLGDVKEEFLLCSELKTTTKSADIMEKIKTFFDSAKLSWKSVCGICTDGAPAMLGSNSGFRKKIKDLAPQAKGTHCVIHRYALASKTLPTSLQNVLNSVIKIVYRIKSGSLNTRLFKQLCKDMSSSHEVLLFYTSVRWLSKGNVLSRVFEMKDEIKLFAKTHKKEFLYFFNDELWMKSLAYLADIFEKLNRFNLKWQGKNTNIIQLRDSLNAFYSKLQNWRRKVVQGNIAMFENSSSALKEDEQLDERLKTSITQHLQSLETEFKRYFPELKEQEVAFVRNPFSTALDVSDILDELQDQFYDLHNNSSARDVFQEMELPRFWCSMSESYPQVSELACRILLPFATTYLCESGFSALVQIKTKARNRWKVEDDMRLALSNTKPRIPKLALQLQSQPSH